MEFKINNSTVRICFGDICSSSCQVIVSSDDCHLSQGGGVSMAIAKAGGPAISANARKLAPVSLGEVAVTTAGDLEQRYVFHAVTIEWGGVSASKPHNMDELRTFIVRNAVSRSIKLLQVLRLRSIAFPLIGTGVAGIPSELSLRTMLESFVEELNLTQCGLTVELWFYGMDKGTIYGMVGSAVTELFSLSLSRTRKDVGDNGGLLDFSASNATLANNRFSLKDGKESQDVFISYSRKDSELARRICRFLDERGFSYWLDMDEISGGQSYEARITRAIDNSDSLLFVSTGHSNTSDWCQKEVGYAFKMGKHVIPLRMDESMFGESIRMDLVRIDHIDFTNDEASALQRLRHALELRRLDKPDGTEMSFPS